MIFGAEQTIEGGKAFYADVKGRMRAIYRDPDHLKILPAAFVVVGDTIEEAQAKRAHLDSLVHYDSGIRSLSIMLDYDVSGFDPDRYFPTSPRATPASRAATGWSRPRARRISRSGSLPRAPAAMRGWPLWAPRTVSPMRWRHGSRSAPRTGST
ncbi:hypothetical protein ACFSUK_05280 [Sphingobium scionense]